MTSLERDLLLHLRLDEIVREPSFADVVHAPASGDETGVTTAVAPDISTIVDVSRHGNDGHVRGDIEVVEDPDFGHVLEFGGTLDRVEFAGPLLPAHRGARTVSFWILTDGDDAGGVPVVLASADDERIVLAPGGSLTYECAGPDGLDRLTATLPVPGDEPDWSHVALVRDPTTESVTWFIDGDRQITGRFPGPAPRVAVELLGGPEGARFRGRLSNLRVFGRALEADELRTIADGDRTSEASFRERFAVELSCFSDDDEPALYIVDPELPGRDLHFVVRNISPFPVELPRRLAEDASPEQHHLELRFRPGTLVENSERAVTLTRHNWLVDRATHADGTVSIYLLYPRGLTIDPGERLVLTLHYFKADPRGGARGTRVELLFHDLRLHAKPQPVTASAHRIAHLDVVNQAGRRESPLRVEFLGSNGVWNDGSSENTLELLVSNTSALTDLHFAPVWSESPTRLQIFLDTGEANDDWALSDPDDMQAIDLTLHRTGWITRKEILSGVPVWTLTPRDVGDEATLGVREEGMRITLTDVVSRLRSGSTRLYFRYENLPGFWDAEYVLPIEKTPLLYREEVTRAEDGRVEVDARVGIRTSEPLASLHVAEGEGVDRTLTPPSETTGESPEDGPPEALVGGRGCVLLGSPGPKLTIKSLMALTQAALDEPGTEEKDASSHQALRESLSTLTDTDETAVPDRILAQLDAGNDGDGERRYSLALGKDAIQARRREAVNVLRLQPEGGGLQIGGDARIQGTTTIDGQLAAGDTTVTSLQTMDVNQRVTASIDVDGDLKAETASVAQLTVGAPSPPEFDVGRGDLDLEGRLVVGSSTLIESRTRSDGSQSALRIHAAAEAHELHLLEHRGDDPGPSMMLRNENLDVKHEDPDGDRYVTFAAKERGALTLFAQGRNSDTTPVLRWEGELTDSETPTIKDVRVRIHGDLIVDSEVKAKLKNFAIAHPTRPDHQLVHACIEGPEAGVYYRGSGRLSAGRCTVELPDYFEALTRPEDRTVQLTARGREPFLLSYEDVEDGRFVVHGTKPDGEFAWEVKAVRADVGRLVVEVAPEVAAGARGG